MNQTPPSTPSLPHISFENLFEIDSFGHRLWRYWLGEDVFLKFRDRFSKMGESGAKATPLSQLADRFSPALNTFSPQGERIDQVSYHPAYRELKRLSYGQEIVSLKYNKDFLKNHRRHRHQLGFAIASYFAQTETGLFCPICMTDALGRVLERHNVSPQTQNTLERIASADIDHLWEGAMFLTEKQGGSDVGANLVRAHEQNGHWLLTGDKWFCSNADAEASLVLARMPGTEGTLEKGTRGLGLFLVLRNEPHSNHKTWMTHRLKDKLGVRSMASGEISFDQTEGFLIAGAGEGFKVMTEMVNMSRIYNAVSSLAVARRSLLEAVAFGRQRQAFGTSLDRLPLWRAAVADLSAEYLALQFLIFETTRLLDQADNDDGEAQQLLRLTTPLAKALGGKFAVFAASESMELIGGNGYIEEHILPRLLRDAQVLPIWEGTTHIQSLDLLRALQKEGPTSLISRCEKALKSASTSPALALAARQSLSLFTEELKASSTLDAESLQRTARARLEKAGRLLSICLLLEGTRDPALKPALEAATTRLLKRPSPTGALAGFSADELSSTEDILIDIIFKN